MPTRIRINQDKAWKVKSCACGEYAHFGPVSTGSGFASKSPLYPEAEKASGKANSASAKKPSGRVSRNRLASDVRGAAEPATTPLAVRCPPPLPSSQSRQNHCAMRSERI